MINEDQDSAVLIVRLINEIENDLVIEYSTVEKPGGALGL